MDKLSEILLYSSRVIYFKSSEIWNKASDSSKEPILISIKRANFFYPLYFSAIFKGMDKAARLI